MPSWYFKIVLSDTTYERKKQWMQTVYRLAATTAIVVEKKNDWPQ